MTIQKRDLNLNWVLRSVTVMVFLNSFAFICFIALWFCTSSAFVERRLLCSSETISMWYTYDGPLYYAMANVSPCSLGVPVYNVTYTIIPMFTIASIGYHVIVHYKGQLWMEHTQPDVACEDAKICYIIKGETLYETFPLIVKKFNGPQGEYQIYLTVIVFDDVQGTLPLRFNITLDVKNAGGKKNTFFPQLGVL